MTELEQVEDFISKCNFDGLKKVLQKYALSLQTQSPSPIPASSMDIEPVNEALPPAVLPQGPKFVPIQSFAWDQGSYNSPLVTIYVDLPGVGTVKDRVTCEFGPNLFDLKVRITYFVFISVFICLNCFCLLGDGVRGEKLPNNKR